MQIIIHADGLHKKPMTISLNVNANWLILMDTFRRKLKSHEAMNLFECLFIIYLTGISKI